MTASDIEQRTDEAVTTVLCQDATLQSLMGRSAATDDVVVDYDDLGDARLPAVAKQIVTSARIGGAGDNWRIIIDLTVLASGNGAKAKVRSILERIESVVTVALLEAQGLDGVVLQVGPRVPMRLERQGTRDLYGETTTLTLWVTK